jgi:hypothetical protein
MFSLLLTLISNADHYANLAQANLHYFLIFYIYILTKASNRNHVSSITYVKKWSIQLNHVKSNDIFTSSHPQISSKSFNMRWNIQLHDLPPLFSFYAFHTHYKMTKQANLDVTVCLLLYPTILTPSLHSAFLSQPIRCNCENINFNTSTLSQFYYFLTSTNCCYNSTYISYLTHYWLLRCGVHCPLTIITEIAPCSNMLPLYKHKVGGAPWRMSIKIIYCTSLTVEEKQKAEYNTLQVIAQVCTLF